MKFHALIQKSLLALSAIGSIALASPLAPRNETLEAEARASDWWFGNIERTGRVPFGSNSNYPVFRNVKDYGAKGGQ